MKIRVHHAHGYDEHDNVNKFRNVGGSYSDRTLHVYKAKRLHAIYNANQWIKVVVVEDNEN